MKHNFDTYDALEVAGARICLPKTSLHNSKVFVPLWRRLLNMISATLLFSITFLGLPVYFLSNYPQLHIKWTGRIGLIVIVTSGLIYLVYNKFFRPG